MTESVLFPLIGGVLIGLSALLLMVCNGAIAGISGIFQSVIAGSFRELWKVAFLLGLIGGAAAYFLISGTEQPLPTPSLLLAISAGAIVGFGTKLGGGCTSGHGVCGISRFSTRSIVATVVFMGSGIATVSVIRHVL